MAEHKQAINQNLPDSLKRSMERFQVKLLNYLCIPTLILIIFSFNFRRKIACQFSLKVLSFLIENLSLFFTNLNFLSIARRSNGSWFIRIDRCLVWSWTRWNHANDLHFGQEEVNVVNVYCYLVQGIKLKTY